MSTVWPPTALPVNSPAHEAVGTPVSRMPVQTPGVQTDLERVNLSDVAVSATHMAAPETRRTISVVVPVYNSEGTLSDLVAGLQDELGMIADEYEVILVNDGSRDTSWSVVCQLAQRYDFVRGIDLMRNYGQHNALLAGIRVARYDITVTMDDDLQHPPEEICKLLSKLDEGYDAVYGVPRQEQHGLLRNLASQMTKLALQNAMGAETARRVSAFRAFRTQVRDGFANYQGSFVSLDVLLTWTTTRFSSVIVRHEPRRFGL